MTNAREARVSDIHEIYAIKYGTHDRPKAENYISGTDPHDVREPIDYFVWAISGPSGTYVVDTGFDEAMAKKRGRKIEKPIAEGLKAIGVAPDSIKNVIISHLPLRPLRQLRHVPERTLPRAGHRDGLRDRALHVPQAHARPVRGGGRGRDGAQGFCRPRHVP
jgi:glyoxylase-like metal-dependent hydrolase (beta-lactamase superfamily II)